MQEVDINNLVYESIFLKENISKDTIIVGKINVLYIYHKYDKLDLSKLECKKIYYYNQEGESIKNHILPNSLECLFCSYNQLISLPNLPDSLKVLNCENNQLTSLPDLPNLLRELWCSNNQLTSLPDLPDSLKELYCYENKLTSLPQLPNSLNRIEFGIINMNKMEYNPNYKNINCIFLRSKIIIGNYVIKSEEDYILYMEDYEKYLFSKVKSARN